MKHIFVVFGPTGCGKSTIGKYVSSRSSYQFLEGDDYHPKANKDKMEALTPLTDEDRWGWLEDLSQAALSGLVTNDVMLVACSALKKAYRDVFRRAVQDRDDLKLTFIYARIDEATSMQRVERRRMRDGNYMKSGMVRSQFQTLEEPREAELAADIVVVDDGAEDSIFMEEAWQKIRKIVAGRENGGIPL